MKKTLLIILFGITTNIVLGQARVGSSAAAIKSDFKNQYELESGYVDDGDYYIAIKMERAGVIHYFKSDMICYLSFIKPNDQGALNYYVELYNTKNVIVSPTQWRMYSENGIANINLIYPKDGGYFFRWSK